MPQAVTARIETFLWQPPDRFASGVGRYALPPLRVLYSLIREIAAGQISLRAMSLVYTTLLSVVPLIAFSFSVLKGFGFHERAEPLLYNVLEPLGEKGVELTDRVISFVDNVSGRILGGIGLLLLLYTVISMIQKVENSFNYIWHVERTRSIGRRFSDYLSVLLIGPIVVVTAVGTIGTISSNVIVQQLTELEPFGTTIVLAGELAPALLLTVLFTFLYVFITNTRVRFTAGLVGGVTAGFLWALAGKVFAAFVVGSTKFAAIYTSFAILILALIWLYVSWLILLLGSQVAFYLQHPEYMRVGRRREPVVGRRRDAMALELMLRVGRSFLAGPPGEKAGRIAGELGVPEDTLAPVVENLQQSGLLAHGEDGTLMPGRDLANIRLVDIFEALRLPSADAAPARREGPDVAALLDELSSAIRTTLRDRTLRDLLQEERD